MFRITILLVLFTFAFAYNEQEALLLVRKMQEKLFRIQELQAQLAKSEKRAKQYEDKYLALLGRSEVTGSEDRYTRERQANKIRELEDQVKTLLEKQKSSFDQYVRKISSLEQELQDQRAVNLREISKTKDQCQTKFRNQIKENNNALSTELAEKNAECRREVGNFRDRIKQLEESAVNKAKQLANKFETTRTELITRAKNFLSGKGPYTRQEEEAFAEFKSKVSSLEEKIRQKLLQINRIKQEKEDIEFEQRYCKAKLTNFDEQIKELERAAVSKGKGYYIQELKRLYKQRSDNDQSIVKEDLSRAFKEKIETLQEKLRVQLEENHNLHQQKREAEEKFSQSRDKQAELRSKNIANESELSKLRFQTSQFRKLIKQIYGLKEK